jgi:hypothetical protein
MEQLFLVQMVDASLLLINADQPMHAKTDINVAMMDHAVFFYLYVH